MSAKKPVLRLIAGLAFAIALNFGGNLSLVAQELADQRALVEQELAELKTRITLGEQRKKELVDEINSLEKDRKTINRQLIETSADSRNIEKRISRSEIRLEELRSQEADVKFSLNQKRDLLAEVLGALQRMGRKPPPALLVKPEDALSSVRSAILLGSVVPEVRSEAGILIGQLQDLARISAEIGQQRAALVTDLSSLAQEEERLNLLLAEKRKLSGQAQSLLAEESARAAGLAAKATSLESLIADLEREIESARKAAELARLAEKRREESGRPVPEPQERTELFADTGRSEPAIDFADTRGLLPLPVSGVQMNGFGEDDGAGDVTDGMTIATVIGGRVIAPADAWVVYAGPFRSYGQLLILNAGSGYHIVLAGMDRIDVQPGQFVLLGEPVGLMGEKRVANLGMVDVSTTRPTFYVEFRKDGKSIDPSPWWADNNTERVSNGS